MGPMGYPGLTELFRTPGQEEPDPSSPHQAQRRVGYRRCPRSQGPRLASLTQAAGFPDRPGLREGTEMRTWGRSALPRYLGASESC